MAAAAVHAVGAQAAGDGVVAASAGDGVVAGCADELVEAVLAREAVGEAVAGRHVVGDASDETLDADEAIMADALARGRAFVRLRNRFSPGRNPVYGVGPVPC